MTAPLAPFICDPIPEMPGWVTWKAPDSNRFIAQGLGDLALRREDSTSGAAHARLRMLPGIRHSNARDAVHGAIIMGFADVALFASYQILCDGDAAGAMTVDMTHQFMGAGRINEPLDAVTEVLRETGRLVFLRGMIEQGPDRIAAFSGTIRKPTRR